MKGLATIRPYTQLHASQKNHYFYCDAVATGQGVEKRTTAENQMNCMGSRPYPRMTHHE